MSVANETTPLGGVDKLSAGIKLVGAKANGVRIRIIEDHAIAQVFAAKGQAGAVAAKLGVSANPGEATVSDSYTAIPLSPGQWMLHANKDTAGKNGGFCQELTATLSGIGYASEQSHARVILRVSGEDALRVVQKGCRLDLHESVTGAGFCAQTNIAQTGVILHQLDHSPTYDMLVYSGFAKCFWDWLVHSSAEFGVTVE